MNYVVIPARWSSSRLPGKPLMKIGNKAMIQWVYESCEKSNADKIFVATDSEKIRDQVLGFKGEVIMTSSDHNTGTDRISEAITKINCHDDDLIINVQGDEPFISYKDINTLIENFKDDFEMATLYKTLTKEDQEDKNTVKINVIDNIATSFSRDFKSSSTIHHHLGIYAYRCDFLKKFVKYSQTENEIRENLEQFRALDNGHRIKAFKSYSLRSFGIDTKEDLNRANEIVK